MSLHGQKFAIFVVVVVGTMWICNTRYIMQFQFYINLNKLLEDDTQRNWANCLLFSSPSYHPLNQWCPNLFCCEPKFAINTICQPGSAFWAPSVIQGKEGEKH
jgi:hypothetical protein